MKHSIVSSGAVVLAMGLLAGCATPGNHDHHGGFIFGSATDKNIASASIRSVDVPNSKGLSGQSGERAVAAIDRLNSGEQTELSDLSASGVGSSVSD